MTSKDLERGSGGDRSPGIAAAERARVVANGVTTFEARARTGRTTPTEREALLGSPEHRSRSQGYDLARKIVGTVVLGTCVGVAALSSQTRGYFMRSMGSTDPRPYIVDFGDSVSPSFKHQAFVYRCDGESDLLTKLAERNHHGMYDYYAVTQVTVGEPSFEKCYTKHFSSNPLDAVPKPVYFTEMAAHKGKMIGMFRLPENKISAGFVNAFESCPTMQHEHGPSCNPAHESYAIGSCDAAMNPTPQTVEKYFNCVKGCQVSMLNGKFCGGADPKCLAVVLADVPDISSECEANHVPNEAEIQNAISKVNDGHFAVVGLAERYADSVRKLRAYLTGQGATAMMGKNRKVARMGELEDLKPLVPFGDGPDVVKNAEARVAEIMKQKGLRDLADERLHAAAYEWFQSH
ncbi:predicted protein [Micromonas commoda]|uniref:Uncharacterized protein n=1 Tax=Micromonas commoda (strain RCC299 / NOUM17 / CCMP2709) TaxID=296587 RepID=C1FG08_MICCC|nr:predicted protein [Micromonas commoda]ACO69174.1 predicted protein [Micromonas commoda]|eukprot:XP_002507916.1 predicted protein [Micromonas commoda]